jgi:hypothetical protein
MVKPTSKKKSKKKNKSAAERKFEYAQRQHAASVRRVFTNAGFIRFPKLADKAFTLTDHISSDFDDIFLFENLLICAEYTASSSDNVPDHLRKKKIVYDKIIECPTLIVSALCDLDIDLKTSIENHYREDEIIVRCIYCSRNDFDNKHKEIASSANYLEQLR